MSDPKLNPGPMRHSSAMDNETRQILQNAQELITKKEMENYQLRVTIENLKHKQLQMARTIASQADTLAKQAETIAYFTSDVAPSSLQSSLEHKPTDSSTQKEVPRIKSTPNIPSFPSNDKNTTPNKTIGQTLESSTNSVPSNPMITNSITFGSHSIPPTVQSVGKTPTKDVFKRPEPTSSPITPLRSPMINDIKQPSAIKQENTLNISELKDNNNLTLPNQSMVKPDPILSKYDQAESPGLRSFMMKRYQNELEQKALESLMKDEIKKEPRIPSPPLPNLTSNSSNINFVALQNHFNKYISKTKEETGFIGSQVIGNDNPNKDGALNSNFVQQLSKEQSMHLQNADSTKTTPNDAQNNNIPGINNLFNNERKDLVNGSNNPQTDPASAPENNSNTFVRKRGRPRKYGNTGLSRREHARLLRKKKKLNRQLNTENQQNVPEDSNQPKENTPTDVMSQEGNEAKSRGRPAGSFKTENSTNENVETDASKPFACTECSYSSTQKGSLKNHIRSRHEKIKPFRCPECGYAAALKQNLKVHVKNVHGKTLDSNSIVEQQPNSEPNQPNSILPQQTNQQNMINSPMT